MATRSIPILSTTPRAPLRSVARKLWDAVHAMSEARATRQLLIEMEPRMRADIGVSRSDAYQEANRPFWDIDSLR